MIGKYMTINEVCEFLKISRYLVNKLVDEKKIPKPKRIFNRNLYLKEDILEYVRGNIVMKGRKK